MQTWERLTPAESRLYARQFRSASVLVIICTALLMWLFSVFSPNRAVDYKNDLAHFYYGSIGADISSGLPSKVLQVLPKMFPEYLPPGSLHQDYTAFGFIQEPDKAQPIGFSTRRRLIDFNGINCGLCHTGTVRESPQAEALIIAGMPANTLNILGYFQFLFKAAEHERFNAKDILTAMEQENLYSPLDGLIYRLVVPIMKKGLLERARKTQFLQDSMYTPFGPGRVSTFDTFKYDQFAAYYRAHNQSIEPDEIFGIVDFPSVWNQAPREGMELHWDGNNTSVRERNFSAAIGAGAKPHEVDTVRLFRIEAWLKTLASPAYPFAIDRVKAEQGKTLYRQYCFECHDFAGRDVGKVVPLEKIGTDRHRLDSYTQFLLEAQQHYTRDYPWTFSHFTKTQGYANQPLDGIWARAPYLHNGSVPTMWDLLMPVEKRPEIFTIGENIYDQEKMGFKHDILKKTTEQNYVQQSGNAFTESTFVLDTALRANGNQGHSGRQYGTQLSDNEKRALIEYLKTL